MYKVKVVIPFLQLFVSNILIVLVSGCIYKKSGIFTDITPVHYKLDLRIPKFSEDNNAFRGESRITIRIEQDIHTISFHSLVSIEEVLLHKINANSVTIWEPVQKRIITTYKPKTIYNYELGIVMLYFDETLICGYYMLQIRFHKSFSTSTMMDGGIRTSCCQNELIELQWLVAIHSGVRGPQAVFPCWDDPKFTMVFDVSVRHPRSHLAYSNSQIEIVYATGHIIDDMVWTHFRSTSRISAHCINIIVLPRSLTYKINFYDNLLWWIPENLRPNWHRIYDFGQNVTTEVIKYLENQRFGHQCNVTKTYYIPIRNFRLRSLITPTFVLYREEDIISFDVMIIDRNIHESMQKINIARLLAEKVAYHWILQITSPAHWSSSRLQEVSKFLGTCIIPEVFPQFRERFWLYSKHDYTTSISYNEYKQTEYIITTKTIISLCTFYHEQLSRKEIQN